MAKVTAQVAGTSAPPSSETRSPIWMYAACGSTLPATDSGPHGRRRASPSGLAARENSDRDRESACELIPSAAGCHTATPHSRAPCAAAVSKSAGRWPYFRPSRRSWTALSATADSPRLRICRADVVRLIDDDEAGRRDMRDFHRFERAASATSLCSCIVLQRSQVDHHAAGLGLRSSSTIEGSSGSDTPLEQTRFLARRRATDSGGFPPPAVCSTPDQWLAVLLKA